MEGPRIPTQEELPNILSFLNSELRPQVSWSIDHEYPTALHSSNIHNMRIIKADDQVVSHAVLRPLIIRTPWMILKVGAIGSVVTHPEHRRLGLSGKILTSCLEEAFQQGCDLAILWTDLYEHYRPYGFELAGYEHTFQIDGPLEEFPPAEKILCTQKISPEAILKLYQKHTVTTVRTVSDIQRYLAIPNSNVYTSWGDDNRLLAYAVEGKGVDLKNHIHEWGGSTTELLRLLGGIYQMRQEPFILMVPHHSSHLIKALENKTSFHHQGYLGMMRVVNEVSFLGKVHRAIQNKTAPSGSSSTKSGGDQEEALSHKQLISLLKGQKNLASLVFGPDEAPGFSGFPLPLWVWGWDSV